MAPRKTIKSTFIIDGYKVKVTAKDYFVERLGVRTKIYFQSTDETPLDILMNWKQKFIKFLKKIAGNVLEEFEYKSTDMIFSKTAGCSYGCSPGFICKDFKNSNIFVEYTLEKLKHTL